MYKKINITENTLQILSLYTNGFKEDYYIREVHKLLKISPRTSQLILEDLEEKGVLSSKNKGKIRTFKLEKSNSNSKEYIIFAEQYKKISFLEKNPLIKEIITQITPSIKGVGVIFGSYVKNTHKKGSDLDLFIIGSYDEKKVASVSKKFGLEISVKCYPLKIFEKNVKTDFLIKEVIKNHVIFLNTEQFINSIFKE